MKTLSQLVTSAMIRLTSQSLPRGKVLNRIDALQTSVAEHLVLVVGYPNVQEQNHWRKELRNLFAKANAHLRSSSVPIKEEHVLNILYVEPLSESRDIEAWIEACSIHMSDHPSNPTIDAAAVESADFKSLILKLLDNPRYLQDNPSLFQ